MPSVWLLAGWAGALFCLAFAAPLYVILAGDVIVSIFPWVWQPGGTWVDLRDVVFAALALGLILRWIRAHDTVPRFIPYLWLWITYGLLGSMTYLTLPENQSYLTGPAAVAYQLYRYCWKGILYYPLTVLLLVGERPRTLVVVAVLIAADVCALEAVSQGYSGLAVQGPFGEKNSLAAVMLIPIVLALMEILDPTSRRSGVFYLCIASAGLTTRALMISGSRSALVAGVVACGVFLWGAVRIPSVRPRVTRLATVTTLLIAVVFSWNPDLSSRPALQRTLSVSTEDGNLQWRLEERWPYFWAKALKRPWLGWGTDVDLSLGANTNTSHNGFLAIAVKRGFPAALVFVVLMLLGLRDGMRTYGSAESPKKRLLGLAVGAGVVGLIIHNTVEDSFDIPFVSIAYWTLLAIGAVEARQQVVQRSGEPSREVIFDSVGWAFPRLSTRGAANKARA
jgi:hypothetical protein